jgi:hypothetical protein
VVGATDPPFLKIRTGVVEILFIPKTYRFVLKLLEIKPSFATIVQDILYFIFVLTTFETCFGPY